MDKELRIIISGGGTGGHIFPAVSIANAIKAKQPEAGIIGFFKSKPGICTLNLSLILSPIIRSQRH